MNTLIRNFLALNKEIINIVFLARKFSWNNFHSDTYVIKLQDFHIRHARRHDFQTFIAGIALRPVKIDQRW